MLTKTLSLVIMGFALSCNTSKTTVASAHTTTKDTKTMTIDYSKEGYHIGIVNYLKDSQCPYIITDEKSGIQFDPVNIDKAIFETYRVDNTKIYFKYRPLRMMNRCSEAQPIELEDIKKREA